MTEGRPLVVVSQTAQRPVDMDTLYKHLRDLAEIKLIELPFRKLGPEEEDTKIEQMVGAEVLFFRTGYATRRVIEALPTVKMISVHGAGLNQVDLEVATEKGIYVTNAPGGNAEAVAELAFGIILALMRRIVKANNLMREGRFEEAIYTGTELQDKTLGIVGLGQIGTRVARIARGFNMATIGYDRYVPPEKFREAGVVPVSLKNLLGEADVVTLHVPLTDETQKIIGAEELGLMRPTAILVNTARGGLVDEDALLEVLKNRRIAGAALDAVNARPVPADHPFLILDNVVMTPHMGGVTHEVRRPIAEMVGADIARFLYGVRPIFIGNREVLRVRARLGLRP